MSKEQQASSSPFFLFPNPNPHMCSINIPEPIILLPGIDPDSFLNPKTHADHELKPMAPLDVDPCSVASLTEVVTIRTHLTASEHAGGSFTEPSMAPMASNSSAHSETSTPQIVNDVAETKIESKYAQIVHCDVCNVTCNSDEMLKVHNEGKKHLKNLQKRSESDGKNPDSLENAPPVESLFTCNIPNLARHDLNIFAVTEHPDGEKQKTLVINDPLRTSLNRTLVLSSNSGTEKAEDARLWCELCKITCSSKRNLMRHNMGKKHLKNLQFSEKFQNRRSTTTLIFTPPVSMSMEKVGDSEEVRNANCKISKCFEKHVKGKKYCTNLKETEKITGVPSVIIQPNDPIENPRLTKGEVVNSKNGYSMPCELCGVICRSKDELSRHLSGKKHSKTVNLTEKVNGHGDAPVTERMVEDVRNEEGGKVVILETGKRKANDSLASEEGADVKRKKIMKEGIATSASISCYLCNVVCTNLVAFTDHLAGQEHSDMVMKQIK